MTFMRCCNFLLFLIFTIVMINTSVAEDSPILPDSSHVSMRLHNISQIESPGGAITHRFPPNISMGDIRVDRLNNPVLNVTSKKSRNRFDITSLKSEHKPGELLVKYTKKLPKKDFENFYKSQNMTIIKDYPGIGYHLIRVDESRLENTMDSLSLSDKFEDAEPNYIVKALKTPNDSRFRELWAMDNTGQTGGKPDADIDAPQAWDISTGSKEVIVAVIDTGVDYTHEDLAGNMWTNSGEIPGNGIDDDSNGFVDDYYGWDFAYDDNDPMDVYTHGTHVSGTIGGVGNNGKGVAGVSWNTHIMAVKFLDDEGNGYTSDAIDAINYATMMGADIMSNSWGGEEYSLSLKAAIQAADDAGILFVAAAGNGAGNTDQYPFYPAGYDVPNVMSIAATDQNDNLADFSNYGTSTVDIGAPGVDILSSVPGNSYSSFSGTSMAAPHVSGAAALLKAFNSSLTHLEIKELLMNSVDPIPSLYGKTVTGGRLNIHTAITSIIVCPIGCNYGSIQAAIDAANPGNTIIVKKGTYYENLGVNKQLTLRGIGMPVVDARGNGSVITLDADGIILEGFTVTRGASYPEAGIKVISNNNTLRDNIVSNNSYGGIILKSSRNNVIYNNIFNNTQNVQIINSNINKWNITKQSGPNLINGIYLGGNFWKKPDGTGFSQKCKDGNLDGICDLAYTLDSNNIDYLPFSTKGPVYNIKKDTYYTSIQTAINDASNGDEIHVYSGTFYENVKVNKKLILSGIGMPVVKARGSGSAITLSADGITLEGFNATMAGSYIDYYYNNPEPGIRVTSNNNTLINNNANENYGYGIYLDFSSNNTLIGNNANSNFGFDNMGGIGISLSSSTNNTLIGNHANSNRLGIFLYSSNFNNITSNNISNSTSVGIKVYDTSKNNTVSSNKVTNGNSGIFFVYAFNTTASNNIMENNSFNFGVGGNLLSHFEGNNIATSNLANGRPIYYVKHGKNTIYDGSTKNHRYLSQWWRKLDTRKNLFDKLDING